MNDGDLAKAQVAASLLKFPDPADLPSERRDKAAILKAAGWMLIEWDPDKHPRTGTTPNAGWFAPVDEGATGRASAATHGTQSPNSSKVTWHSRQTERLMDKETARSLLDLATSMDSTFHKMFAKIDSISDIDLKSALETSLGEALKHITVGVIFSIEKQFPELKVD